MSRVIGITGGIASGKTAVENFLAAFPVINADDVSREVVAPGQPGLAAIVEHFGEEILQADGTLNRKALRRIIARDQAAQQQLNQMLHPRIGAAIQAKLAALQHEPVVFVSAALMMETGSYQRYDAVILVSAPTEIRLARLLARDQMDVEVAKALMAKQWPDEKKRPLATVEIVNDGDLELLLQRTQAALATLGISWR